MGTVVIHPRIMERHPELTEENVCEAWEGYVRMMRDNGHAIALGFDGKGRALEMVAKCQGGDYLVYHALTPPTGNALRELGLTRRSL